jgi:hypothetical protein
MLQQTTPIVEAEPMKVAIVILADTETHGDVGRVANALEFAKDLKQARDDVELIFDGAGVKWAAELSKETHQMKPLFETVRDRAAGVCEYCARAFGAFEAVKRSGLPLLAEFDRHPSLRSRAAKGYQVVTF